MTVSELPERSLTIASLDQEGRGIGRLDGKATFVEGALPGERVVFRTLRDKPSFTTGTLVRVERPSAMRVEPRCPHFTVCGGCSMQHLDLRAQVAIKQRVLEDNLARIAKVTPEVIYRPVRGPDWGYRLRARLSVRNVVKKGGVLVGFHERQSSWVADMTSCPVLPPLVSGLLVPLRRLVESLSVRTRLPQIELAVGEGDTALVLRLLEPLTAADETALRAFAADHGISFWLQPKGPDSVAPFANAAPQLRYSLPEFGVTLPFLPTDFTQVNHAVNRALVHRALSLLDPLPSDRVLDLFCGLGNFTLPIATRARTVLGIEGNPGLVARAAANAAANGLTERARFLARNLFEPDAAEIARLGPWDKVLIDPPREGAIEACRALLGLGAGAPGRIVYVSCAPATLARDAALLCHEGGYRLRGAGVFNMFPHTSHVESIALFERP